MKNKVTSSEYGEIALSKGGVCLSYGGRRKDLKLILLFLWCFCLFTAQVSFAQNTKSSNSHPASQLLLKNIGLIEKTIDSKDSLDDSSFDRAADEKDGFEFTEQSAEEAQAVKSVVNKKPTLHSEKINFIERPEDDELILQVRFNNLVFADNIFAYLNDNGQLLVPLSAIAELLEFPIHVDPSRGTAAGWFIREGNKFSLSSPYSMISIADKTSPVKGGAVEPHIDDIYVTIDELSKWFPLEFIFNFNELSLQITAHEKLPFIAAIERKAHWETINTKKAEKAKLKAKDKGPVVKLPSHRFSAPIIQMSDSNLYSNIKGSTNIISNHAFQAEGELFGMDMRTSGSITSQTSTGRIEIGDNSFTLSKYDIDGHIGGKLKATEVNIGDVSSISIPLVGGYQGRGVNITNKPVNFVNDISDFKIEGFGPVGWDVELYQDENLLDFQTIKLDGKYSFKKLQLSSGFNLMHIILYGPNGEKRERFERFYIGQNMIKKGEFIYSASALQSSSPLIDLKRIKTKTTSPTLSLRGEYGLNKDTSLIGGIYKGLLLDKETNAITIGARISGKRSFTQVNSILTGDQAYTLSVNSTGNIGKDISWRAGYTTNKKYSGANIPDKYTAFVGFSKPFSLKLLPKGNYGLTVREVKTNSNLKTRSYKNRISFSLLGMSLSNNLEYLQQVTAQTPDDFTGDLTASFRSKLGNVRGRINYDIKSKLSFINSIEASINKTLSDKISLNGAISADLTNGLSYKIQGGASIKLKKMKLGINTNISDTGDYSIAANMAYNFVPRSRYGDYTITTSDNNSSSGKIIIRPFIDLNQNNHLDKGEETIEGIKFRNERSGATAVTGKRGSAILDGLSPNVINKIVLDTESIPDIYTIPKFKYFNVLGKSGINGTLIFPLVKLGEISGILGHININGEFTAIADTHIILLDKNNKVVAETDSEYDGFYLFPSLPMGKYQTFFPKSDSINSIYLGDGNGPIFTLNTDEPELSDADLLVTSQDILLRKSDE